MGKHFSFSSIILEQFLQFWLEIKLFKNESVFEDIHLEEKSVSDFRMGI